MITLLEALRNSAEHHDCKVNINYSGYGMHDRKCVALSGEEANIRTTLAITQCTLLDVVTDISHCYAVEDEANDQKL